MDLSSDPPNPSPDTSPPNSYTIEVEMESIETPCPTLPTFTIPTSTATLPTLLPSSNPLSSDPFSPAGISASIHRPQTRKRAPLSLSFDLPNKRTTPITQPNSARDAILQARDLIVQAYSYTKSREEQSKLLDLLEVFREFTERGRIQNASSILASQVAHLESATQQIEKKTRALASTKPSETGLSNSASTVSFASIASKGAEPSTTTQEWTVVGKKKTATTSKAAENPQLTQPTKDRANWLILVKLPTGNSASFLPLATRNAFNKVFADKGIKGPVVTSVTKS